MQKKRRIFYFSIALGLLIQFSQVNLSFAKTLGQMLEDSGFKVERLQVNGVVYQHELLYAKYLVFHDGAPPFGRSLVPIPVLVNGDRIGNTTFNSSEWASFLILLDHYLDTEINDISMMDLGYLYSYFHQYWSICNVGVLKIISHSLYESLRSLSDTKGVTSDEVVGALRMIRFVLTGRYRYGGSLKHLQTEAFKPDFDALLSLIPR